MRCESCKYWGLNKEFEQDLSAAASPTGQYPWICPKCGAPTYITKNGERVVYDQEAIFLLEKLREIVDSGDFDASELNDYLNDLLEYKGKTFRYGLDISRFVKYARARIEEKKA